jgi:apolipoprotein D and lipocalin family protein
MKKRFIILLICSGLYTCAQTAPGMKEHDTTPVTGFELERYLGTWYEIARFPHRFEKNLVGVTATYSLKKNGKVKVQNAGYKNSLDGKFKTATGKAKFAGDPNTGHLKVSFFLFFYADYFIIELDKEDYQWAVIGSSSPDYFWILSRNPQMDDSLFQELCDRAIQKGYDLSPLQMVPHKL